ncbi:hypothetical protein [Lactococcus lactis]|uniref:hypothetical protein n=1 Tax=Lactococcus lactis TaxID=1358 RepID=UPI003D17409C
MTEKNENSRKIVIGKTTYILSSNFVPNEENKRRLLEALEHLIKQENFREKP